MRLRVGRGCASNAENDGNWDDCGADNSLKSCKCGEPSDGWPGKDGGELCQMCWEGESSDAWWEMFTPSKEAV